MKTKIVCVVCGSNYDSVLTHTCLDCWRVVCPEYEFGMPRTIYAGNAKEAALKYAQEHDLEDDSFEILRGPAVEIKVVSESGGVFWFLVSGESIPEYTANRIAGPKEAI